MVLDPNVLVANRELHGESISESSTTHWHAAHAQYMDFYNPNVTMSSIRNFKGKWVSGGSMMNLTNSKDGIFKHAHNVNNVEFKS